MRVLISGCVFLTYITVCCLAIGTPPIDTVELIKGYGYPAESYSVQTEDGYILALYRIPYGINDMNSTTNRPPILLVHGLGSSGSDYLSLGPDHSIGYTLADRGYDVWLFNARGNSYSQKNVLLDPNLEPELFYDFSFHEIGYYDLPATIDFILEQTGEEKIYYIGHSQGGTTFLVLTSEKPEYNNKIRLATLLAPAVYLHNCGPIMRTFSELGPMVEAVNKLFKIYSLGVVDDIRTVVLNLCTHPELYSTCQQIFYVLGYGYEDNGQLDPVTLPQIYRALPNDMSWKQAYHFFQMVRNNDFRQYDYGVIGNLAKYGHVTPPNYDLTNVYAPVSMYVGRHDQNVSPEDTDRIAEQIQNLTKYVVVSNPKINHGDFLFAKDAFKLFYDDIIETLEDY